MKLPVHSVRRSASFPYGIRMSLQPVNKLVTSMLITPCHIKEYSIVDKGEVLPTTGNEDPEEKQKYSSTLSLTSAIDVGVWSTLRPGRFTPGKNRYPLYRRLGVPQGRSGRVLEISLPHRNSIPAPSRP